MLTLEKMLRMAAEIDEMASEIHVSPLIGEQLQKHCTDSKEPTSFFNIRVIVDRYYEPSWWSEHYRDKIVLHTDKGTTTIPGFRLRIKPLSFGKFEIVAPEPPAERTDKTHG